VFPSCAAGDEGGDPLPDKICRGTFRCWLGNCDGDIFEGPTATNNKPLDKARMHIMPNSSWIVIQLRSCSDSRLSGSNEDAGRAEATRADVLLWKGW
jgi:hypothetical protein